MQRDAKGAEMKVQVNVSRTQIMPVILDVSAETSKNREELLELASSRLDALLLEGIPWESETHESEATGMELNDSETWEIFVYNDRTNEWEALE